MWNMRHLFGGSNLTFRKDFRLKMFSACLCDHVVQLGRSVREHRKDKDGKISWNFLFIDKTSSFCTGAAFRCEYAP